MLGVGIYKFEYGKLPKFAQSIKILIPKFTNCAKKVDKQLFINKEITNIKHNIVSDPIIKPTMRLEIKKYVFTVFSV